MSSRRIARVKLNNFTRAINYAVGTVFSAITGIKLLYLLYICHFGGTESIPLYTEKACTNVK